MARRRPTLIAVLVLLGTLGLPPVAAQVPSGDDGTEPAPAWVGQARSGAAELGGQLKQALRSAIAEGGPVAAVEVCNLRAPEIAERVSTGDLDVGRTALKIRNPDNRPDAWEKRMLESFERRLTAGEAARELEVFAVRKEDGRRWGHWMKAIPTGGLCTACHGKEIPTAVADAIDRAYPRDQARGFSVGDLRGAFSVEVELNPE